MIILRQISELTSRALRVLSFGRLCGVLRLLEELGENELPNLVEISLYPQYCAELSTLIEEYNKLGRKIYSFARSDSEYRILNTSAISSV